MEKKQNPNREKAFALWKESNGKRTLKEIAIELGVSYSQILRWKRVDDWESKKPKRKRGAPPGNQNAKGNKGGAPLGSKNAFRHGAYERVVKGLLEPDEVEIFEDTATHDVEADLRQTLAALNAKEARLMKHIAQIKASSQGSLVLDGVIKTKTLKPDKNSVETTITKTTSLFDALGKLETELDRVHGRKIKVLTQLESIRLDRERLVLEKQKYSLMKQKLEGIFEIDPETGEIEEVDPGES